MKQPTWVHSNLPGLRQKKNTLDQFPGYGLTLVVIHNLFSCGGPPHSSLFNQGLGITHVQEAGPLKIYLCTHPNWHNTIFFHLQLYKSPTLNWCSHQFITPGLRLTSLVHITFTHSQTHLFKLNTWLCTYNQYITQNRTYTFTNTPPCLPQASLGPLLPTLHQYPVLLTESSLFTEILHTACKPHFHNFIICNIFCLIVSLLVFCINVYECYIMVLHDST